MHPIEALKASFIGCLRNWLPFLIYSLLMLVLLTLGLVPLGLGLLVVLPLSFASMYVSYRDIYHAD
ncbi:MAG: hypothetical protein BSR46_02755 [Candidatus Dactylopiibacterium carminicum]|nr:MAG: hypothetical protein BSR46_02755 [Candidatus Dactylopiibacterium carminicum]